MAVLKCLETRVDKQMRKVDLSNREITFPIIGKVTFNEKNEITVDNAVLNDFLALECGFKFEVINDKVQAGDVVNAQAAYEKELKALSVEEINALLSIHDENETKSLVKLKEKIKFLVNKQFA